MRTLVFGDIHGGLKALLQLFKRANITQQDKLIFLGDYVDGWSESVQVIEFLMDLEGKQTCIFIKGNHDAWCEKWLRTGQADSVWVHHGGYLTLDAYTFLDKKTRDKHLDFFELMRFYYTSEKNDLYVHAGFTSMHGSSKEFHIEDCYWDRTLWEMALALDKNIKKDSPLFPKRLVHFNEIYIGHTPTIRFRSDVPIHAGNLWNIDTGAAFTGKLTCMDIDTKEIFQSDPLPVLYPNERGRN